MPETRCLHFSGYKPCSHSQGSAANCNSKCPQRQIPTLHVLFVHLGALGAVVRSTSLLSAIRRKYPGAHITWVTDSLSAQLLKGHPRIHRLLTTGHKDLLALKALHFDIALNIDKSIEASGVLAHTTYDILYGFETDISSGAILPANHGAEELWSLGIDDHLKFKVNQKPETQLMVEALELGAFQRDEYDLPLSLTETSLAQERRKLWSRTNQPIVGINTGCSSVIPMKKWTVEYHREVIQRLKAEGLRNIVLLGGPEDTVRNERIAHGLDVFQSSTRNGLRDGLISVDACDLVLTGDSLGLHMAIARKKFVVAWFGPTCSHEIDLYERGVALKSELSCSPCWKRTCQKSVLCYDQVDTNDVFSAITRGLECIQMNEVPNQEPPRTPIER